MKKTVHKVKKHFYDKFDAFYNDHPILFIVAIGAICGIGVPMVLLPIFKSIFI